MVLASANRVFFLCIFDEASIEGGGGVLRCKDPVCKRVDIPTSLCIYLIDSCTVFLVHVEMFLNKTCIYPHRNYLGFRWNI